MKIIKSKPKYCKICQNTGLCQSCEGRGCMECNYTGCCRRCQDVTYQDADPRERLEISILGKRDSQ